MIDFLIVGTFKSASSTLAFELRQHNQIDIPAAKDPYFFLARLAKVWTGPKDFMVKHDAHSIYDRAAFEALFKDGAENALKGEATPLYLYCHEQAIPAICADNPQARIVILLRNPIDRAFSNYNHNVKDGHEKRNFSEIIANWAVTEHLPLHPFFHYVNAGFYDTQVAAYQNVFEHVNIVSYDDVRTRAHEVLNEIASFLDITPCFDPHKSIRMNKSGKPRSRLLHDFIRNESFLKRVARPIYRATVSKPETRKVISEQIKNFNMKSGKMDPADRATLAEIYRDDITRLSQRPGCAFVRDWLR